ncbi:hypothetical protein [Ferrovibrio terrae]|uniref:hypothetical protein n=1 Tax=Ferrovibrio terrae TaxID=2594003 RepID=UPI003137A0E1
MTSITGPNSPRDSALPSVATQADVNSPEAKSKVPNTRFIRIQGVVYEVFLDDRAAGRTTLHPVESERSDRISSAKP